VEAFWSLILQAVVVTGKRHGPNRCLSRVTEADWGRIITRNEEPNTLRLGRRQERKICVIIR